MHLKLRFSPIIAQSRDQIIIFTITFEEVLPRRTRWYIMTLVSSVVSEIVGGGQKWPPLAVRVTKISVAVRVLNSVIEKV